MKDPHDISVHQGTFSRPYPAIHHFLSPFTASPQYFADLYNEYVDIDTPILIAVLRIPSYIIVLNTLVPISLYVRYLRSQLVDLSMFITCFHSCDLFLSHNL